MHGLVGFLNLMSGLCSAGATRPSRAQSALGPSRPSLAAAVTAPTWAPRRSSICSDCQIQSCISSHRDDLRLNRARGRPGHWHVLLNSNYHHDQHLGLEIIGITGGGGLRVKCSTVTVTTAGRPQRPGESTKLWCPTRLRLSQAVTVTVTVAQAGLRLPASETVR